MTSETVKALRDWARVRAAEEQIQALPESTPFGQEGEEVLGELYAGMMRMQAHTSAQLLAMAAALDELPLLLAHWETQMLIEGLGNTSPHAMTAQQEALSTLGPYERERRHRELVERTIAVLERLRGPAAAPVDFTARLDALVACGALTRTDRGSYLPGKVAL